MIACFTGHRPNKLNGYNPKDNKELLWRIHDCIIEHIEKYGVDTFINGVALGVDQWSAKIVIRLKEKYPNLKLISAVPCNNHSSKWNKQGKKDWYHIIDNSDQVVYVSEEEYSPWLMQKRNEWMVDRSQYIIAVWDGSDGGTGNCVKYAKKQDKNIYIIRP